jgi:uncharacterized integral membrane protein
MQSFNRALIGIVAAIMSILLVIFGVQNTQPVQIQFLTFATQQISLSLVIITAVVFGAALMWLFGLYGAAQRSMRLRREVKERSTLAARNAELERRLASIEHERDAPPANAEATADAPKPGTAKAQADPPKPGKSGPLG